MRKNFCAAPWAGLSLDPDGQAKLCCISQEKVDLLQFDQARGQPKFMEIRQSFMLDQQHPSCKVCWQREKTNTEWESRRSTYQYNDFYHNLDSAEDFKLQHLDLRWSNTCNLNCVYCGPVYSSKWADLLGHSQRMRIFPTVLDEDLANLKILQLAGGEPMLIKENLDILQRLSTINNNVTIEITTNLTMIENNKIYEVLKTFGHVTFVVSFEAVGEQFEYIRNGANWLQFEKNLKILKKDFSQIQFNMVYFPLSSFNIVEAIQVALEYTNANNIFLVSQIEGHGFDMLSQNSVKYIKQHNLDQIHLLPDILQTRLQDQINMLQTHREQSHLPKYEKFDRLTNQNHRVIFPELYL